MSTEAEILKACIDQPLQAILSLLSTHPDPVPERKMAEVAVAHGRADLLHHLLHNATKPSSLEPRGMLLLDAAGVHSKPCVQVLLDVGLNINLADDRTGGVLHRALGRSGCPEDFIAWLLERGAQPNHPQDWQIDSIVHCLCNAVSHGTIPIMRILIDAGADVHSSRALHYAGWCGYLEKAKFLVEEIGLKVDQPAGVVSSYWYGDAGSTPLHIAAAGGHVEFVEYLLDRGADVEAKNAEGRTPLQVAKYLAGIKATKPLARNLRVGMKWLASKYTVGQEEVVELLKLRGAKDE